MANVLYMGTCAGNSARKIAELLDSKAVTHAVIAYRKSDGDVCYHIVGEEDRTYLIGLITRVGAHLHQTGDWKL